MGAATEQGSGDGLHLVFKVTLCKEDEKSLNSPFIPKDQIGSRQLIRDVIFFLHSAHQEHVVFEETVPEYLSN